MTATAPLPTRALDVASGRVAGLDGIRGIALLLVLIGHYLRLPPFALAGVYLFFILSGYLITGLLTTELRRTGRIRLRRFYLRRILRLAPAYLLWIAVTVVLLARWMTSRDWREVCTLLLYVDNYFQLVDYGPARLSANPWPFAAMVRHGWSLSVEEQFYLLWPVAFLGIRGRAARVMLVLAVLLLTWRFVAGQVASPLYAYRAFETSAGWLALGCWLRLAAFRLPPLRRVRVLEWISRVSYPAYLWHVWAWYLGVTILPGMLGLVLATLGTFVLAAGSTYLLEQPILAWRDRRFPSR